MARNLVILKLHLSVTVQWAKPSVVDLVCRVPKSKDMQSDQVATRCTD